MRGTQCTGRPAADGDKDLYRRRWGTNKCVSDIHVQVKYFLDVGTSSYYWFRNDNRYMPTEESLYSFRQNFDGVSPASLARAICRDHCL